jgi:hypothetical protein
MASHEIAPVAVAHGSLSFRRADDVREKDGGEDKAGLRSVPDSGQELLNFLHEGIRLFAPGGMVSPWDLHESGIRDPVSHVMRAAGIDERIIRPVKDQGWHVE